MSSKAKTSSAQKRRTQASARPNRSLLIVGGIGAMVLVAAVIALALSSGTPTVAEPAESPVTVGGSMLPTYESGTPDAAEGMAVPTLSGTNTQGGSMTIAPEGGAAAIVILSHTCPHCQAELPNLVAYLNDNPPPEGVDIIGLSTLINPAGANYPSADWLAREGWTYPTLLDDANSTAALALGRMGTPGFIYLANNGTVALRMIGFDPEAFGQMLEAIAP
ncbi:MAG TPA: TlpA disulfide reductase family protein [Candidatus Limnocylindria bacterium]